MDTFLHQLTSSNWLRIQVKGFATSYIIWGSQTSSHHSPLTTEDPLTNCTILWFQRSEYINFVAFQRQKQMTVYDAQYESSSSHVDVSNLAGTQSYASQILNFPRLLKFGNALCLLLNVTCVFRKVGAYHSKQNLRLII